MSREVYKEGQKPPTHNSDCCHFPEPYSLGTGRGYSGDWRKSGAEISLGSGASSGPEDTRTGKRGMGHELSQHGIIVLYSTLHNSSKLFRNLRVIIGYCILQKKDLLFLGLSFNVIYSSVGLVK